MNDFFKLIIFSYQFALVIFACVISYNSFDSLDEWLNNQARKFTSISVSSKDFNLFATITTLNSAETFFSFIKYYLVELMRISVSFIYTSHLLQEFDWINSCDLHFAQLIMFKDFFKRNEVELRGNTFQWLAWWFWRWKTFLNV